MPVHPLFDELVLERLRGVPDALTPTLPNSASEAELTLRPGPPDRPEETSLAITFGSSGPGDWAPPETVAQAGRDFAAAWIATGHAMPAFRFALRRDENGAWKAAIEPMEEW